MSLRRWQSISGGPSENQSLDPFSKPHLGRRAGSLNVSRPMVANGKLGYRTTTGVNKLDDWGVLIIQNEVSDNASPYLLEHTFSKYLFALLHWRPYPGSHSDS